jgi:C1A family cysteine protease/uncharacterized membrane protein
MLWVLLLLSVLSGIGLASELRGPINPEFIRWQERAGDHRATAVGTPSEGGYIPEPVDWSHLGRASYPQVGSRAMPLAPLALPAKFDLRSVAGKDYVTPIRDQGRWGTCWAFGTLASLESSQLIREGGSLITTWGDDLSEAYVAWFTYKDTVPFTLDSSYSPFDRGGNFGMTTALLTRRTGPTDEASWPYSRLSNSTSPPLPNSADYQRRLYVKKVLRLSLDRDVSNRAPTIAAMKELLMAGGACGIVYYASEDDKFFNSATYARYCDDSSKGANHAVAVIGWDDNFAASNFKAARQPSRPGAWLVRNSWGSWWANGGYFWLSYDDVTTGDVAFFRGEEPDSYKTMYLHDPLGFTAYAGVTGGLWEANIFRATEDGQIEAVALTTYNSTLDYEVRVFTNLTEENPTKGTMQDDVPIKGTLEYAGYHTIPLDRPVQIKNGERFSIVVRISEPAGQMCYYTVEYPIPSYSDAATANPGESFIASGTSLPTTWTDLTTSTPNVNLCIRALSNPISTVDYAISLSPDGDHTFPPADAGYAAPSPLSVTVSNTGTLPTENLTVDLSGANSSSFTLSRTSIVSLNTGGSDTFTVAPDTGLSVGTYTATVTVSNGNGLSGGFDVSFTVNEPAPTYGISLSVSSNHTFPAANVDYGTQSPLGVTVSNTGNRSTGNLTVALSGVHSGSFILPKTSISSIGMGGSNTFTVVPKTGLSAGTYTATVTVSNGNGNGISASFRVSFTVNPDKATWGISLSRAGTHTFPSAMETTGVPEAITVTVSNTGNRNTGKLTVALSGAADAYALSETSINDLGVNDSNRSGTFTVGPIAGLVHGTYTATVAVSGGNGISRSFNVSFTVTGTSAPVYSISLSPASHIFPAATAGYTPAECEVFVTNTGNRDTGNLTVDLSGANPGSFALSKDSISGLDGSDSFTVAPKTGLPVGTYTATATVKGDNGISESCSFSFTVHGTDPVYDVALGTTGHALPAATAGYASQTALDVPVTNAGNQDTGDLTVGLSGASPGSFALSRTSIVSLNTGGSDSFTVAPRTELPVGTYTATVTVNGDNDISRGFDVSFTVKSPSPYGISLSTGDHTFPPADAGYSAPTPLSVTVSNTGNQPTGSLTVALSGTNGDSFALSKTSIGNLDVDRSDTFTVAPRTGLPVGTYTATVTVSGGNGLSEAFNVNFSVTSAGGGGGGTPGGGVPAPGVGSGGGGGGGGCTGAPGLAWLLPAVFVMRRKRR